MDYASKNWVLSLLNRNKRISLASWSNMLLDTTGPFEIKAFNRDFIAFLAPPIKTGTATSVSGFQLVDSGANFGAVPVPVGSIVRNTSTGLTARVLPNVGTTAMWLNYHIFPATAGYEVYAPPVLPDQFIELTGAKIDGDGVQHANSDTANHLINSTGTVWTGVVSVNDWAWNLSSGRCAQVTNVAAHDLTLMWDCFPNGNEPYLIFANWITINDAESPLIGSAVSIPEMNISGRYIGGRLSAGNVEDDMMQQITGEISNTRVGQTTDQSISSVGALGGKPGPSSGVSSSSTAGTRLIITFDSANSPNARVSDHTQPRTLSQTYIMRIK